MTAAEYRARVATARQHAHHFAKLRNFWRAVVRKRVRQAKEAATRRKARRKPHVVGRNQVRGGSARERLLYAAKVAAKEFRLYYSESGSVYPHLWALTNVPSDSYRSDCSLWFTWLYKTCGLLDPNGGAYGEPVIYTGTLLQGGREVSREFAEKHAGCAVIFGSGTGIHVGMSTGEGPTIYQHGQEPVEGGTFDEFGPGVEVRYRDYLSH